MIRYLKQEEKERTRVLYETSFPEDGPAFVNYYYTHRIKDNRILVMEPEPAAKQSSVTEQESAAGLVQAAELSAVSDEAAEDNSGRPLQVMIHLNPYVFSIYGQEAEIDYIVAVATDDSVRRQGKMAQVLAAALCDMAKERKPFTFLIPANPAVYRSSGFVFVASEQYSKEAKADIKRNSAKEAKADIKRDSPEEAKADFKWNSAKEEHTFLLKRAVKAELPKLVSFANELLEQRYDVFPKKTLEYYERMMAELESENGGILLLAERDVRAPEKTDLRGIFSYGKEGETVEVQELLVPLAYEEAAVHLWKAHFPKENIEIPRMDVMVRILDLQALVPLLKGSFAISRKIWVKDDIIAANQGGFWITLDSEGGKIVPIPKEETEETLEIGALAKQLFGGARICMREWV